MVTTFVTTSMKDTLVLLVVSLTHPFFNDAPHLPDYLWNSHRNVNVSQPRSTCTFQSFIEDRFRNSKISFLLSECLFPSFSCCALCFHFYRWLNEYSPLNTTRNKKVNIICTLYPNIFSTFFTFTLFFLQIRFLCKHKLTY